MDAHRPAGGASFRSRSALPVLRPRPPCPLFVEFPGRVLAGRDSVKVRLERPMSGWRLMLPPPGEMEPVAAAGIEVPLRSLPMKRIALAGMAFILAGVAAAAPAGPSGLRFGGP